MKKLLLMFAILISGCQGAFASQCTQIPYSTNGQVTAVNLNAGLQEPCTVMNGNLDNTNANTSQGYRFYQTVSSLPAAGNTGQVYYLTTDNSLNFDTGSTFIKTIAPSGSPVQGNVLIYGASGLTYAVTGSVGNVLVSGGDGTSPTFTTMSTSNLTGLIGNNIDYIKFTNTQSSGTLGGTATQGSWLSLPINTKDNDTVSIASLCTGNGAPVATCTAANQMVLPAGTYLVSGFQQFVDTGISQTRLYNITGGAILVNGQTVYLSTISSGGTSSIFGYFTLSTTSAVAFQYQVTSTFANDGLGDAGSFGSEVFATIQFTKVL